MSTSQWSPAMVAAIDQQPPPPAPPITRAEVEPLIPGVDLWDFWPVQDQAGHAAVIDGGTLFMLLSSPALPNPDDRHALARIRLMHRVGDEWRDRGNLLPDGWSPGSREWSGSAVIGADARTVTLYFTAAGRRGEAELGFEQRLFEAEAELADDDGPVLVRWSAPREIVAPDGTHFMRDMAGGGALGTIKAFRDPAYFRDPADDREYILFTGSLAQSHSDWNGAVGLVERIDGRWTLGAPLVSADGLNNELERPHVIVHAGRYYLFWSTQRKVFAPTGPTGPNGLYGMVADRIAGPWIPLNGSGLVLANPPHAPFQAYSWLV
ncbi:MAG TPA: glycoside hydrolase family 68 protein, partial [Sphingomonas sp.]